MPTDDAFKTELTSLLARHGVEGVASKPEVHGSPVALPGSAVASYIKEIITGAQAFDEKVLERVVNVLRPTQR